MTSRSSTIALLTCLAVAVATVPIRADQHLPTDQQVCALCATDPQIIGEMVRKLAVLENAVPAFEFPEAQITITRDATHIAYIGDGTLIIGEEPYQLRYSFKQRATQATAAVADDLLLVGKGEAALIVGGAAALAGVIGALIGIGIERAQP